MSAPALVPPAVLWTPPARDNYADLVVDVAELVGRPLDAEQTLAVEALTGCDEHGDWAAFDAVIVEARQNGKTAGPLTMIALTELFLLPPDRIVWTAHRTRTTDATFADIEALIEGCPDLSRRVLRVRRGKGDQAIETKDGAELAFLARSTGQGRGLSGRSITFDEALYLQSGMMASLVPTLSTRPNVQLRYGSSAGLMQSAVLRALRRRAEKATRPVDPVPDPSLAYVEWRADGSFAEPGCADDECTHVYGVAEGCRLDDEAQWAKANHTLGRRIKATYVRNERRTLAPVDFATERMGWWQDPPTEDDAKLSVEAWTAAAAPAVDEGLSAPAFGIATSWDRAWSAVVAATYRPDGRVQIELVRYRRGTGWLAADVIERLQRNPGAIVGALGKTTPAKVIADIEAAGWDVETLSHADYVTACSDFVAAITAEGGPTAVHLGDPNLHTAVVAAATKDRDDGAWVWWQTDSAADITPLAAVTVAHHLIATGDLGFASETF